MTTTLTDPPPQTRVAPPPAISSRRKAAVVVQLLIADGHDLSLSGLPEGVQADLTRELGQLRMVDRATVDAIASEFADLLEAVGLTAPGGMDGAISALADRISPAAAARLRAEADAARGTRDPWLSVLALPDADLLGILADEGVEAAAIVVSKLPVARAAALLGQLPGERARRVTFAMSRTGDIRPVTVDRIGTAIARAHAGGGVAAFEGSPQARVGAILDNAVTDKRAALLEGLEQSDAGFAEKVRRAIFTFADIPARLAPVDVPKVVRGVDAAALVAAFAHAGVLGAQATEAAEFLLSNMPQRLADQLREETAERGAVRPADGEEGMRAVTAAIRTAEAGGEITLRVPDEKDEAD